MAQVWLVTAREKRGYNARNILSYDYKTTINANIKWYTQQYPVINSFILFQVNALFLKKSSNILFIEIINVQYSLSFNILSTLSVLTSEFSK